MLENPNSVAYKQEAERNKGNFLEGEKYAQYIEREVQKRINSLEKIREKKNRQEPLSEEDRIAIRDAMILADILKSRNEEKKLVIEHFRELTDSLKELVEEELRVIRMSREDLERFRGELLELKKDEKKVIAKYLGLTDEDVKDINLLSALDVISKGKIGTDGADYESWTWREAGYVSDGFFGPTELKKLNELVKKIDREKLSKYTELKNQGISIGDLLVTEAILDRVSPNDIYKILFDADNSLEIGEGDNKSIIRFREVYQLASKLIDGGKERQILNSIGELLGGSFPTRKDLFDYIKKNPEEKYRLLITITKLAGAGDSGALYVSDILLYGKEAVRVSLERKSKIDKYINEIFGVEMEKLGKKYDTAISEFESKIPEEKKEQYKALIDILRENETKRRVFENIKLNGVGILASLIEGKSGLAALASFSNKELDNYLRNKVSSIISGVNFDIGFGKLGGKIVPGIGASLDLGKDLGENTRVFGKVGIINLIPYALAGIETQLNLDEVKKQGFTDLTKKAEYLGASVNVLPLGWGLGIYYREDRLKGIEQKEKQFNEFLDKAITEEGVNDSYIKSIEDYEKNRSYYDDFIKNINKALNLSNFHSLPIDYKKAIISSLKTSLSFIWKENMLKAAEKKGYEFSGIGVGIQFIAGFLPLPTFGVAFEKVGLEYKENQVSKLYAIFGSMIENSESNKKPESTKQIEESKKNNNENKPEVEKNDKENNVDGESKIDVKGITLTSNIFKENEPKFRRFAQNNPKNWKKLVTGNLDFHEQVSLVIKMLSGKRNASENRKFFLQIAGELKKLNYSKNDEDQKKLRDLMAQFFDVVFKDERNTSEVILGYTVDKNGRYEGRFDFKTSRFRAIERFARSQGLESFSALTQELYNEIASEHQKELEKFRKTKKPSDVPKLSSVSDKTLFGLVASYKIDDEGRSLGKGFIDIPIGQVSKVDGKEKIINNQKDKEFVAKRFAESYYGKIAWEGIKKIIESKNLGVDLSKVDFKKALLTGEIYNENGKTIKINSQFVAFLYGQCANESLGLRILSIHINGFDIPKKPDISEVPSVETGQKETVIGSEWLSPEALLYIQANVTNIVEGNEKEIKVGAVGGGSTGGNGQSTTPGAEQIGGSGSGGGGGPPSPEGGGR